MINSTHQYTFFVKRLNLSGITNKKSKISQIHLYVFSVHISHWLITIFSASSIPSGG